MAETQRPSSAAGALSAPVRRVGLPGGGTLVIRPVVAADVDGLAALYDGLDHDARYRRFFSVYSPARLFFERMTDVADRGGAGLVAAVADAPGAVERIVAEASFEVLPNGNGELAITVDAPWRGWLGPYLLDALLDTAAAVGVPNLEADILTTNGPMLALARSRRSATMPSGDWTVMRMVIGARSRTPTWPVRATGPRIVVEGAGGNWHLADTAHADGFEVLGCPGPAGRRFRCPVISGEPCPLAAGADAIVISHPPDLAAWDALRAAHARLHPGVPVCVELPVHGAAALPGETTVPTDDDAIAFVEQVAEAHRSAADGLGER